MATLKLEIVTPEAKTYSEDVDMVTLPGAEGEMVEAIHGALGTADVIILNPAGYTHTSVVLRDAIQAVRLPTIEVHLSNIYAREEFREKSITARACVGTISGFQAKSYILALQAAKYLIEQKPE